jgi:hypothetical protein
VRPPGCVLLAKEARGEGRHNKRYQPFAGVRLRLEPFADRHTTEFNKSIVKYPNIERFPGGASNDMIPNFYTCGQIPICGK